MEWCLEPIHMSPKVKQMGEVMARFSESSIATLSKDEACRCVQHFGIALAQGVRAFVLADPSTLLCIACHSYPLVASRLFAAQKSSASVGIQPWLAGRVLRRTGATKSLLFRGPLFAWAVGIVLLSPIAAMANCPLHRQSIPAGLIKRCLHVHDFRSTPCVALTQRCWHLLAQPCQLFCFAAGRCLMSALPGNRVVGAKPQRNPRLASSHTDTPQKAHLQSLLGVQGISHADWACRSFWNRFKMCVIGCASALACERLP